MTKNAKGVTGAIFLSFFLLFAASNPANAMPKMDSSKVWQCLYDSVSYLFVDLDLLSDNVYLGRRDSIASPYTTPYIGFQSGSGWYGKVMVSMARLQGRVDLVDLELGLDHSFGNNFTAGFCLDKYFFHNKTSVIMGNVKACTYWYAIYNNKVIEPQLIFTTNTGKRTDYIVGFSVDHVCSLAHNTLNIKPMATFYSGTRYFLDEYYVHKNNRTDGNVKTNKIVQDADKFGPHAVDLSAQTTWWIGRWYFTFTPTYAIPLNPATLVFPNRRVKEQNSNSFYVELDISLRRAHGKYDMK